MKHEIAPQELNLPLSKEEAGRLHDQLQEFLACFLPGEHLELRKVDGRLGAVIMGVVFRARAL